MARTQPLLASLGGGQHGRGSDETPVSSPLHLDAAEAPPFFLAHGDHDSYVPVEMARAFERHLRSQSAHEVVYVALPGAQHGFDLFRSWRFSAVIDGIDAFLTYVQPSIGQEAAQGRARAVPSGATDREPSEPRPLQT